MVISQNYWVKPGGLEDDNYRTTMKGMSSSSDVIEKGKFNFQNIKEKMNCLRNWSISLIMPGHINAVSIVGDQRNSPRNMMKKKHKKRKTFPKQRWGGMCYC